MSANDIKELIPLIGHRSVFIKYWRNKYCTYSTSNTEELSQGSDCVSEKVQVQIVIYL